MPTRAKRSASRRLNERGHPAAAALLSSDAAETALCAALSAATLVALLADATLGWWWADPLASLAIVHCAIREGRETLGARLAYGDA